MPEIEEIIKLLSEIIEELKKQNPKIALFEKLEYNKEFLLNITKEN